MTITKTETVVDRGAAMLDEHDPDWYERVDPTCLDIGSPCNCVGGQLYGHYAKFVNRLGTKLTGHTHGFTWGYSSGMSPAELNEAWRDAILARRHCW